MMGELYTYVYSGLHNGRGRGGVCALMFKMLLVFERFYQPPHLVVMLVSTKAPVPKSHLQTIQLLDH